MKNWELKEDHDAKTIKGRKNRGSGNRWYNPGDSRSDNFLVESKFTERKSYSLNRNRIQKICNEALLVFKIPLFMVQIQDLEVVVMMKEDWEKIINHPK
jgi:hypothetical protein